MKKYFLLLIIALSSQVSFGQPNFILGDTLVQADTDFCMDVTTRDFTDIVAMSFSINWDPNILDFLGVEGFELPGLEVSTFNLDQVDDGKLGLETWESLDNPITLLDGSTIFQICFNSLPECGTSPLDFTNDPSPIYTSREFAYPINTGAFLYNGQVVQQLLIYEVQNDTLICFGDSIQMDMEVAPDVNSIQWSSVNGNLDFSCTDCPQPFVSFNGNTPFDHPVDTATVVVTNTEGCQELLWIALSTNIYVDMFPQEPIRYFCEGEDISFANEDILIGPYAYHWTGPNNFNDTQIFPTIENATLEDAGIYTVEVTDLYGCGFSLQFELIPAIQVTLEEVIPESCLGNLDGSITVSVQGGEGDLAFIWSNGSTAPYTIDDLVSGNYFLTVVDENACSGSLENIIVSTGLVTNITSDTTICGGETLQLLVEAPNAESFQWTSLEPLSCTDCPNPVVETPFLDDTYIVEVTGPNGCMDTAEVNVQVRQYLDFGLLQFSNSPVCEGDTLFLEPNVFGAQSYTWGTPTGSVLTGPDVYITNFSENDVGNYSLDIIDDAGCMAGAVFEVQLTDVLPLSSYIVEPTCFESCDGSIELTPVGSHPPYTYTWSTGDNEAVLSNLCEGTYDVTVSSENCSTTETYVLTDPDELALQYEVTSNASCLGGGGMITIWVTGGYQPYWVDWGNGPIENPPVLEDLSAGVYSITITDANDCTIVSPDIEVTDNPIFNISEDLLICEGEIAPLQIEAPFASVISWSPALGLDDPTSPTPIASPSQTTTYSATVIDINGCMGTASVTVFVGNDNCVWVNEDVITVGASGVWCDPTLGPLGLEITDVTCGPQGFIDFSVNNEANCYQYTGLSVGIDSVCMTLCYTGTDICFEGLLVVTVEEEDLVWPGDTDTDGFANHFDILNIGLGYGTTGPVRPDATVDWEGQTAPNWLQQTPISGINYKHIDCDGDGEIELQDLGAIILNWGFEHEFNRTDSFDRNALIPFYVQPDVLIEGTEVSLPIILGDMTTQAEDVYGLAFSLIYDPEVIVQNSVEADFTESWLGTWGVDAIAIQKDFYPEGRIDIGITRTDGVNVSGSGTIGHLILTIEDDILLLPPVNGLVNDQSTFFDIQNVRLINASEETISVNPSPTESEIVTSNKQLDLSSQIRVFPNPAKEQLYIDSEQIKLEQIELLDINGRILQSIIPQSPLVSIPTGGLSSGIYLIRGYSKQGIVKKRIVVQ